MEDRGPDPGPDPAPAIGFGGLVCDSATMQGRPSVQEDRHVKIADLAKAARALKMPIDHLPQPCSFLGVFDGHRGHLCSDFVAKSFHAKLLKKLAAEPAPEAWTDQRFQGLFEQIFAELDAEFLAKYRTATDGCSVAVALLTGPRIICAWAGDCRCLLGKLSSSAELEHEMLTREHRPSRAEESQRIKSAGGIVLDLGEGYGFVAHQGYEERRREIVRAHALGLGTIGKEPAALDISRALGDRDFKGSEGRGSLIISAPGVVAKQLDPSVQFVALACGGLGSVLSDAELAGRLDLLFDEDDVAADVRTGCGSLVQYAYQQGAQTNLTVVLARLRWGGDSAPDYFRKTVAQADADAAAAAAILAEKAKSAAAASKRRRLDTAASVTAQKIAAYEKMGVQEADAAEVVRKDAELQAMRAEFDHLRAGATEQSEEASKGSENGGSNAMDAAEAFFASRRAKGLQKDDTPPSTAGGKDHPPPAGAEKSPRAHPPDPSGLSQATELAPEAPVEDLVFL